MCPQYHVFSAVMKIVWRELSLFFVSCFGSETLASKHLSKYVSFKNYSFFLCCLSAFSISWDVYIWFGCLHASMHLDTAPSHPQAKNYWCVSEQKEVSNLALQVLHYKALSFICSCFIFTAALPGSHTHQKLHQARNLLCRIHYICDVWGVFFHCILHWEHL